MDKAAHLQSENLEPAAFLFPPRSCSTAQCAHTDSQKYPLACVYSPIGILRTTPRRKISQRLTPNNRKRNRPSSRPTQPHAQQSPSEKSSGRAVTRVLKPGSRQIYRNFPCQASAIRRIRSFILVSLDGRSQLLSVLVYFVQRFDRKPRLRFSASKIPMYFCRLLKCRRQIGRRFVSSSRMPI